MPSKKSKSRRRRSPTHAPKRPAPVSQAPAPSPATLPRLLTVPEVAQFLRTSPKAVYAMVHRGYLPGVVRPSRRILIDEGKLLAWVEERRVSSLPQKDGEP